MTIGNFDGVHLGHQTICNNSYTIARQRGLQFLICTFEPHPMELFAKDRAPARLTLPERKQQLLSALRPDVLLMQNFTWEFASMQPQQFVIDAVVKAMNARVIVVGKNFRFGKARAGDIDMLKHMGRTNGFEVIAEDLLSTTDEVISSTRIRKHIIDGDVASAARLLNRHHELPGKVVTGKQVGNKIGFPTINISAEAVLVPGDGIFAAFVDVGNDTNVPAAVYIGDRPTLAHGHSIEAHLLNFNRNAYGNNAVIQFVKKIRDNHKFSTVDQLKKQIADDVIAIRETLESCS
ncbi:MAG: riboflavin biosynthesis protein RibF [Deltaproteobacteria bacterium]|nr:riboflavin biosynthesis protein RibF [Deltaproteobacteria bacterium]